MKLSQSSGTFHTINTTVQTPAKLCGWTCDCQFVTSAYYQGSHW